jgi:transposase
LEGNSEAILRPGSYQLPGLGRFLCLNISGFHWPVKDEPDSDLGMSKTFRPWKIDEPLFLPPTVQDLVGPGHLARFVLRLVREAIDLSKITGTYGSERGQPPFDPIMMTVLMLYSYCCGIYSSRRIAKACRERVDFMSLVGARCTILISPAFAQNQNQQGTTKAIIVVLQARLPAPAFPFLRLALASTG